MSSGNPTINNINNLKQKEIKKGSIKLMRDYLR